MSMPKTVVVAALLMVSIVTSLAQQTGKTIRKHRVVEESPLANAETAIDKKDYDTAEKLLRQAVAAKPNDFQAWFDLGYVLNATGRTAESIEAYRKSVQSNSRVFESNLNLGLMLAKTGDPEAATYLRAATQLKPTAHPEEGWARAWLALGHVLEKSNPQGAVEAFKAAATFHPRDPEPHLSAAMVLEGLKQYAAAEQEYRAASDLDPKSSDAVAGLVNVYMETGRLAEAEPVLRKYIALDPQSATAHVQLGRVLAALGKTEEATTELQQGLQLKPGDPIATRELADLLLQAKKPAEAEQLLRPLLQAQPNDAGLHYALGRTLLYGGKTQEAQQEFLTAIKLNPKMGEAYGDLAIAADRNQNYPLTIQALDARAKLLDETPATYFLRATAYDHLRYTKEAADYYRRFLQVADGKFPDQEWKARHRLIAIDPGKKP
jgi:tetratricopeptide (TPR) repeat protein